MSVTIFWLSGLTIIYVYIAYYQFLRIFGAVVGRDIRPACMETSKYLDITIIVAAFNEEKHIKSRLENIFVLDYPMENLEVIVASDGSDDKTVEIAKMFPNVRVLDFKVNRGKASVHNESVREALSEIIVFTDAETEFKIDFLKVVNSYFNAYDYIGCVVGNLIYRSTGASVSESEGFYWSFEKRLRAAETKLGLLATSTGACMAVRKRLWRELTAIDDSDFTTPLDVILQGCRVVYAKEAIAFDVPPVSVKGEFRTRVRQTSKNLVGTLKRWGLRGFLKHPVVSFALVSHKFLRWMTLFLMLAVLVSNVMLVHDGLIYQIVLFLQVAFYGAAFVGLLGQIMDRRLPVVSTVFNFCVANLGMGAGVIKGLIGKAPASYKPH